MWKNHDEGTLTSEMMKGFRGVSEKVSRRSLRGSLICASETTKRDNHDRNEIAFEKDSAGLEFVYFLLVLHYLRFGTGDFTRYPFYCAIGPSIHSTFNSSAGDCMILYIYFSCEYLFRCIFIIIGVWVRNWDGVESYSTSSREIGTSCLIPGRHEW